MGANEPKGRKQWKESDEQENQIGQASFAQLPVLRVV
jgi:hypothetical protein